MSNNSITPLDTFLQECVNGIIERCPDLDTYDALCNQLDNERSWFARSLAFRLPVVVDGDDFNQQYSETLAKRADRWKGVTNE